MTRQTPMAQLKGLMAELSDLLARHGIKEVNLNKSAPKSFTPFNQGEPSGVTFVNKGVASDFIRLHQFSLSAEQTYAFGLKFSYLDESAPASVTLSLKIGKSGTEYSRIIAGETLSVEDAKTALRNTVRFLRTLSEDTSALDCAKQIAPLLMEGFSDKLNEVIAHTELSQPFKAMRSC